MGGAVGAGLGWHAKRVDPELFGADRHEVSL